MMSILTQLLVVMVIVIIGNYLYISPLTFNNLFSHRPSYRHANHERMGCGGWFSGCHGIHGGIYWTN